MPELKSICVYCGANPGARPLYRDTAAAVGRLLAREGITMVFGGGRVGLMGAAADAALAAGGRVVGVIPRQLVDRELAHPGVREMHVVRSMHERKQLMADLSDGFIALPGGMGTFEEILETLTWAQLGIHAKPCGFVNAGGYYDRLFAFLDGAAEEDFVRAEHRALALSAPDGATLLSMMRAYEPPTLIRWMDRGGR